MWKWRDWASIGTCTALTELNVDQARLIDFAQIDGHEEEIRMLSHLPFLRSLSACGIVGESIDPLPDSIMRLLLSNLSSTITHLFLDANSTITDTTFYHILTPLCNLENLSIQYKLDWHPPDRSKYEQQQLTSQGVVEAITTNTRKLKILQFNQYFTRQQLCLLHRTCPISLLDAHITVTDIIEFQDEDDDDDDIPPRFNLDDHWQYLAQQLSHHSATPIKHMIVTRPYQSYMTPKGFMHLAQFTSLTKLQLLNSSAPKSSVTDDMIEQLAPLKQLTHLELHDCHDLTDAAMSFIAHTFPLLEKLHVTENIWKITDESWSSFAIMTRLRELELGSSHHLTHRGLLSFVQQASHTFRVDHHRRALQTSDILPASPLILSMTCLPPNQTGFSFNNNKSVSLHTSTSASLLRFAIHHESLESFLFAARTQLPRPSSILPSHIYPLSKLHLTPCPCHDIDHCPHRPRPGEQAEYRDYQQDQDQDEEEDEDD